MLAESCFCYYLTVTNQDQDLAGLNIVLIHY